MSNIDDYLNDIPTPPKRKLNLVSDTLWNLLTVLMLLLTIGAVTFFVGMLRNPAASTNPFLPNTIVPPPNTPTGTPLGYDATWTPTVTVPPTETNTPRPTITIIPSDTPYVIALATSNFSTTPLLPPSRTPKPASSPYSVTITYNQSGTFRPDTSCDSMYVAGQALDVNNIPVRGLVIKLGGSIPGKTYLPDKNTTLTGINKIYGESGFEFDLKVKPHNSIMGLWVQLYDLSGAPLSTQFKFSTFEDCEKNLALIRFQQK